MNPNASQPDAESSPARPGEPGPDERVLVGMAAALGAFFMFSVMMAFAKLLSDRHSVIEIAFYRNLIATALFLVLIFGFDRREILRTRAKPRLVALRAVIGAVSLCVTFAAFALMPLADATAVLFTSSLFIPILALLILKESVGVWRWTAVAIGFAGVLVMAQPGGGVTLLGLSVGITAALIHGFMAVILRYLSRFESPETISFYFCLIGMLLTALPLPFVAVQPTRGEIPLLFGVGATGAAAQWLLSLAFKHARATVVTIFNYSSIVWATLIGWLLFDDLPTRAVIAGATIVIASNLVIAWREARLGRLSGARVRARL